MRLTRAAMAAALAMLPVMVAAQQFLPAAAGAVDPNVRFEVVSIRPWDPAGNSPLALRMTPGRFDSSVPVGGLLGQALQKQDYRIVGAPGWIDSARYTIAATAPADLPPGAMTVLLLNLLKDRFQLQTHLETRELPIFNLVRTRTDGRLGPDLKPTSAECQATIVERNAAFKASAGRGGPPPLPVLPGPDDPLPCGFARTPPGTVAFTGRTMDQFILILSDLARRPVIDKTGLTGMYDVALKFAAETAGSATLLGLGASGPPPVADPNAPSFFTAMEEQLGLKLESARGPVEVAVIDRLERPTLD
jgi:uncharacterized protein (TIGR03435 family)